MRNFQEKKDTTDLLNAFLDCAMADEKELLNTVIKYYTKYKRHKYHIVSEYIYDSLKSGNSDTIEYLLDSINYFMEYLQDVSTNDEKKALIKEANRENKIISLKQIILNIQKLYDHISLEDDRLVNNSRIIQSSKNEVEQHIMQKFQSTSEDFKKKVDETSNSLNANIITIVGLFSAIIFVFFGGVTSLSSFVNGIFEIKNIHQTYYPILALLIIGFIIFNTIFLLLYTISKIVNKNIGCKIKLKNTMACTFEDEESNCKIRMSLLITKSKYLEYDEHTHTKTIHKAKRKVLLAKLAIHIYNLGQKLIFRFPIIFVIDSILLIFIIYIYIKIIKIPNFFTFC